jgi:hypothetical protein
MVAGQCTADKVVLIRIDSCCRLVSSLALRHPVLVCPPDAQGQLCGTLGENVLAETRTTVSQSFL